MIINCKKCGRKVETKYSGTKYCKECSEIVKKERKRIERKRKREEKREKKIGKKGKLNGIKKSSGLDKYLYPYCNNVGQKASICFDCERACGGCCWSEVDTETDKIRFQPVPGWKARKTTIKINNKWEYSYFVYECPLFIKSPEKTENIIEKS